MKKSSRVSEGTREDAVAAAISNLENQFGKGTVMRKNLADHMSKQMSRTSDMSIVHDIALAHDMMIELAPSLVEAESQQQPRAPGTPIGPSKFREVVGQIVMRTDLDKRFITFHLRYAVNDAKSGELLSLPTGADLITKETTRREEAERARVERQRIDDESTEMIAGRRIKTLPAHGRGQGRPTYGHTSIGTSFAPEGMTDEDAVEYLSNKYRGAPMWRFDISRDPETGKLYAYFEIDTSG
jgi:hypothetical protein